MTAPIYGLVSDRFGRKPVLVFGLVGSAVFLTFFGASRSLVQAIIWRALCGAFNGKSGPRRWQF